MTIFVCALAASVRTSSNVAHDGAYLPRHVIQNHPHRSLGIFVLLEFDKCFFDLVQFVPGINEHAALPGFGRVYVVSSEF